MLLNTILIKELKRETESREDFTLNYLSTHLFFPILPVGGSPPPTDQITTIFNLPVQSRRTRPNIPKFRIKFVSEVLEII